MSKIKITLADAKAELRDAATGPRSQHWSYAPAVKVLLNSHDELLSILGEATAALEEKDRQVKELLAAREAQPAGYEWKQHYSGIGKSGPWVKLNDKRTFEKLRARHAGDADYEFREMFTAPPMGTEDYFSTLVKAARLAADKAMRKHPQPNYVLLKVAEEAGEVVQAGVHFAENRMDWNHVEGEIVQLMAMLIRLVTEGDQVNGITPPDSCHAAMRG
ncbi:hypothetical protein ABQ397_04295 [Serratia fonticola]|uniref:hypothetical protein n=1 Tax=Serratia fonticola TaxID=47917 RepID=UPI003AAB310A